jgi:hypothetical protein
VKLLIGLSQLCLIWIEPNWNIEPAKADPKEIGYKNRFLEESNQKLVKKRKFLSFLFINYINNTYSKTQVDH